MASCSATRPNGVGLGLRWDFLEEVVNGPKLDVAFFEVSPENYMRRGGYFPAQLERVRERYTLFSHGLTLSIGAAAEPPESYLRELEGEIARLAPPFHSDHLCFSTAGTRVLHDLLPLKFARENVTRVADRARRIQDRLGLPLGLENISYYAHLGRREMPEAEFVASVIEKSQVGLLLDVNNVYVNSQNHGESALDFLRAMPLERVVEIHVAGHERQGDLLIDTHGASVCDPVLELLEWTLERTGPVPVLLERDNDVPALSELLGEVAELSRIYERAVARFQGAHARSA
ncbi:MAG: DUF692 domain-containing protein [Polyangiaceae bacterium]